MQSLKYLNDYLKALGVRQNDSVRKPSFLYLADFAGINTGCEFSYHHYTVQCGQTELIDEAPLTRAQLEKLDVLVEQDTKVLDSLCTIVRFHKLGCSEQKLVDVVLPLKQHTGEKLNTAWALANHLFGISTPTTMACSGAQKSIARVDLFPGITSPVHN